MTIDEIMEALKVESWANSDNNAAFALIDTFTDDPGASFVLLAILGHALKIPDRTLIKSLAEYYCTHQDDIGREALLNLSKQYPGSVESP